MMRLIQLLCFTSLLAACSTTATIAPVEDVQPQGPGSSLLEQAQIHQDRGELSQAMALVERVVRMEPRNSYAWHRLAQLHLAAGETEKAIQFAKRSNQMAGNNQALITKNLHLIESAQGRL